MSFRGLLRFSSLLVLCRKDIRFPIFLPCPNTQLLYSHFFLSALGLLSSKLDCYSSLFHETWAEHFFSYPFAWAFFFALFKNFRYLTFYILSLHTYNLEFYFNPKYGTLNGIRITGGEHNSYRNGCFLGSLHEIFPSKLFSCKSLVVFIEYQVICKCF